MNSSAAAHAPQAADSEGVTMDAQRLTTTLRATWEIDALCESALRSIGALPTDDMDGTDFVLKALLLRIETLNNAVMSALGDEVVTTNAIQVMIQPYSGVH